MAAPEIVNAAGLEAEKRMPEQRVLGDTIKAIQDLDTAYDERSTEARRRLLAIEETLDKNVANFTPAKQEQLAERVQFIKNLLAKLESSPNFNLVQQEYEYDPIRHKEKLVEDQKKYQALLDRFGASGLQLVEAHGSARSRIEYGISHQGNYLGNLIVGDIAKQETEGELIVQIMQLLSFHKIPFRLEQNQEFANLPYTIDISPDQRAFIEGLGLRLTKDGIFGLNDQQGNSINFRWNEPGTKRITIKILDPTSEIWQLAVANTDNSEDIGTIRGRTVIGISSGVINNVQFR